MRSRIDFFTKSPFKTTLISSLFPFIRRKILSFFCFSLPANVPRFTLCSRSTQKKAQSFLNTSPPFWSQKTSRPKNQSRGLIFQWTIQFSKIDPKSRSRLPACGSSLNKETSSRLNFWSKLLRLTPRHLQPLPQPPQGSVGGPGKTWTSDPTLIKRVL